MKRVTAVVFPGLWFNPLGPIAEEMRDNGLDVLEVIGKESMSARIGVLKRYLYGNTHVKTVFCHSAGGLSFANALRSGGLSGIEQVVLANSAPMPGIPFGFKDPAFWAMAKYMPDMFLKNPIGLTDEDTKNLMGLTDLELEEVRPSLVKDSGAFIGEIVRGQLKFWQKPKRGFIQESLGHDRVWVLTASNDRMIGSCGQKNNRIFDGRNITMEGNHLTAITNINATLETLRNHGCEI